MTRKQILKAFDRARSPETHSMHVHGAQETGYIVERGGVQSHQRFLKNPDYKGKWPVDTDWTFASGAHVFENENEAHKWVRENEGEGQFSVVDADTGEKIEDSRESQSSLPEFNSAVKRYIDTTGDSYPGQESWYKG